MNDYLERFFSSRLSVRVGQGAKYKFIGQYYIEIEGHIIK